MCPCQSGNDSPFLILFWSSYWLKLAQETCGTVPSELDGTKDGIYGSLAQGLITMGSLIAVIEVSDRGTGSICLLS